ncbi:MAG: ATP-binding cassette domain-containing protein [Chitinivibrionales bacterium]|nr:ATP-binding cassette domain-containing protein [Chitinivibrionales bacterium]MBD3397444.1 ATP-binding cassette domain-containing protein [Chitinivibrionales bacterium]
MSVVETKGVSKTYHESTVPVHALTDVSMKLDEKEFAALVGPSGSGKSTMLNMIGGLDAPTKGSVSVGTRDLAALSVPQLVEFRLHNIGFVFQAFNLIPVLTARENVEFIMLLQKQKKRERHERAEELLQAVGIADRADHRPSQLSGGEQQRVAVARALASRPTLVLADEPTANLDSHAAENLLDIMARLNEEYGTVFLFSTHDERVIRRARRVITLHDGRIASDERHD